MPKRISPNSAIRTQSRMYPHPIPYVITTWHSTLELSLPEERCDGDRVPGHAACRIRPLGSGLFLVLTALIIPVSRAAMGNRRVHAVFAAGPRRERKSQRSKYSHQSAAPIASSSVKKKKI